MDVCELKKIWGAVLAALLVPVGSLGVARYRGAGDQRSRAARSPSRQSQPTRKWSRRPD
jgi:hypothetical protein